MISTAYAAAAPTSGGLVSFLPLLIMFAIVYFLILAPQRKRIKSHQQLLSKLKQGDKVITSSGIYGSITGLTDKVVTLEIADGVRVKVSRPQVSALASDQ